MLFGNKSFDSINATDLQALVDNEVQEGKSVDYKLKLPGNSDADKKEFLADVSSFANASGGYLIFGVKESSGKPINIEGLQNLDSDAAILRLESIVRDGLAPKISGILTRPIVLDNSAMVILMRIPKSWASPHMVVFKNHSRFYSRNSAGKYSLDVSEIRSAFLLSETTADTIRDFRLNRISDISSSETPVVLPQNAKFAIHLIPFSAFEKSVQFDISDLVKKLNIIDPMYSQSWSYTYNFDGFIMFDKLPDSTFTELYVQIFRNGTIEAVDASYLKSINGRKQIPNVNFERQVIASLQSYLSIQKQIGVEPPIFVMLSLLETRGYEIGIEIETTWRLRAWKGHPIDKNELLLQEHIIDDFDCDLFGLLKPSFDAIWNAAGWPRSMNYNENGIRDPKTI